MICGLAIKSLAAFLLFIVHLNVSICYFVLEMDGVAGIQIEKFLFTDSIGKEYRHCSVRGKHLYDSGFTLSMLDQFLVCNIL